MGGEMMESNNRRKFLEEMKTLLEQRLEILKEEECQIKQLETEENKEQVDLSTMIVKTRMSEVSAILLHITSELLQIIIAEKSIK